MKTTSNTFEVTYAKKVGGNGTIIVKAENEAQALKMPNTYALLALILEMLNWLVMNNTLSQENKVSKVLKEQTNAVLNTK